MLILSQNQIVEFADTANEIRRQDEHQSALDHNKTVILYRLWNDLTTF